MQLDQVNNEDRTWWVGSREESCDGADACALGLQKGAFIIDSDQLLSDPASRKIFPPYPLSHLSSVAWLAKRRDRCWAGCWGVNPHHSYPPSHSWAPCTGHEGWDFRSNTPAKHLHSSQLWKHSMVQFRVLQLR